MPDVAYGIGGVLCCGSLFVIAVFVLAIFRGAAPNFDDDLGEF